MELSKEVAGAIVQMLKARGVGELSAIKADVAREFALGGVPSNADVLTALSEEEQKQWRAVLRTKPVRSLSGVAVVAVMSAPAPCPHGTCSYCPRGDKAPQSYTGHEPAAMRAIAHGFNPFDQTDTRVKQLERTGHSTDKVELIIMGGTFPARPPEEQEHFVHRCLDALNGGDSLTLDEAQCNNECASHRCVSITFETRPDYCRTDHIDLMLRLGATRIELGVQTVFDDIYEMVGRGHTVADVVEATRTARDAGFKVNYHLMPGLPGSDRERDLESFRQVFTNPRFCPDMVKVYPTQVLEGTELYDQWRQGDYRPPKTEEMVDLLSEVKSMMPRWVRTMRILRDIPSNRIADGVLAGNLAELVEREMVKRGTKCSCIRCREVGRGQRRERQSPAVSIDFTIEQYEAGNGTELFISADDEDDALLGYCRLRVPSSQAHRDEVGADCAIVRELRVCGEALPLGGHGQEAVQHRGLGRRLLEEAESIACELDKERLLILSGIGVRPYFRRLGYKRMGPYMERRPLTKG